MLKTVQNLILENWKEENIIINMFLCVVCLIFGKYPVPFSMAHWRNTKNCNFIQECNKILSNKYVNRVNIRDIKISLINF